MLNENSEPKKFIEKERELLNSSRNLNKNLSAEEKSEQLNRLEQKLEDLENQCKQKRAEIQKIIDNEGDMRELDIKFLEYQQKEIALKDALRAYHALLVDEQ